MHRQIGCIPENSAKIRPRHFLRVITSGTGHFVDVSIYVDPSLSITEVHHVSHLVEELIRRNFSRCAVQVHIEPDGEKADKINRKFETHFYIEPSNP
ncbi:MAG: hypothetical protein IPN08_16400 [Bacteroidales bacterium]|nr:hypothetical protein [Bacteroidales bacterium]MBK9358935.1 hypothetical protein [Bacteroidales bacterium]